MNKTIQVRPAGTTRLRKPVGRLVALALGLFVALIIIFLFINCSSGESPVSIKTQAYLQSVVATLK